MAKTCVDDFYGSIFLKGDDLDGPSLVTITGFREETMKGDKDPKIVLELKELDRDWVLNTTNSRTLKEYLGGFFEDWIGQQTVVFPTQVEFGGKLCNAVRCRKPKNFKSPETAAVGGDDDTPF